MPDYIKFIDGIIYAEKNGIELYSKIESIVPTIDVLNYIPFSDITKDYAMDIFTSSINEDYLNLVKLELENKLNAVFTKQHPYVKELNWN